MSGASLAMLRSLWGRLARALLPSWRFFDIIEPTPVLSLRVSVAGQETGGWATVPPAAVAPWRVLFNPEGNLALAQQSLLEQLLSDVAEADVVTPDQVEALTSYRLVSRLAREHARRVSPAVTSFQFKLALDDAEDLLVSSVLPL